eukprot:gene4683-14884_t
MFESALLLAGPIDDGRFEHVRMLGSGSFGYVRQVKDSETGKVEG